MAGHSKWANIKHKKAAQLPTLAQHRHTSLWARCATRPSRAFQPVAPVLDGSASHAGQTGAAFEGHRGASAAPYACRRAAALHHKCSNTRSKAARKAPWPPSAPRASTCRPTPRSLCGAQPRGPTPSARTNCGAGRRRKIY